MKIFLLDAGGATLIFVAYGLIILFILLAIMLEALVMILMKYHSRFGKAFWDSTIVNIASLLLGFVLLKLDSNFFGFYNLLTLSIFYGLTVLLESTLLYLRNRSQPLSRTIGVCLVMNLVTYVMLYLIAVDH